MAPENMNNYFKFIDFAAALFILAVIAAVCLFTVI